MSARWESISSNEANQHPLYGVKGWLVVFAVGTLLGILKEFGSLSGEALKAGLTLGQLFALDLPLVTFIKIVLAVELTSVSVTYWLLFTKHPKFRPVVTGIMLCTYPLVFVFGIGIVSHVAGFAAELVKGFFPWAISCAVWVTYLQRSERVRVTFEHCVRTSGSRTPKSATAIPRSNLNTAPVTVPVHEPAPSKSANISLASCQSASMTIPANLDPIDEDKIYTSVAEELETGQIDKGLWTRLFAECAGDEKQVKVLYIKQRVGKLMEAEIARCEKFVLQEAEQQRQVALKAEQSEQLCRRNAGLADSYLIEAVSHGNWAAAKQILESGVSPFGGNDDGVPLRDLALRHGDQQMVDLLKTYEVKSI
jgi:hypothetical protein